MPPLRFFANVISSSPRNSGTLPSLSSLPDEILVKYIFPKLTIHSQVTLLSLSRRFHALLSSSLVLGSRNISLLNKGNFLKYALTAFFNIGVYDAASHDSNALFRTLNALEGSNFSPSNTNTATSVSLCLFAEDGILVQLSFQQIPYLVNPTKDRSRLQGFHAAAVMYDTSDVYSLLESAKCTIGEINKFAAPVTISANSPHLMATQVLLVGNMTKHISHQENPDLVDGASPPEKDTYPADLERAGTLAPLCKRVEFVGCTEIDPNNPANVEAMSRFLARVCYKTSVATKEYGEIVDSSPVRAKRARGCIVM